MHVYEARSLEQVLVFGVVWHRTTVLFGSFAHERRPFFLVAIRCKRAVIGDEPRIVFAEFEPAAGLGMSGGEDCEIYTRIRLEERVLT